LKSNKQKRSELKARKAKKREKDSIAAAVAAREARLEFFRTARARGELPVERTKLRSSHYSYRIPAFVERGTYCPIEFTCKMCGKVEIWTAHQQKWWYEVANGDVFTTATMCRPCRKKERARRDEARRVHLEGVAQKSRRQKS
jgi:hypothetical protein